MNKAIKEIKEGTLLVGVKTNYPYLTVCNFVGIGAVAGDETVEVLNNKGETFALCRREKGSKTICGDRSFEITDENGSTKFFYVEKMQEMGIEYLFDIKTLEDAHNQLISFGNNIRLDLYRKLKDLDVKKI